MQGKEELEQQHSRQTEQLAQRNGSNKAQGILCLTEVGGMVDNQKQGQQRKLDQDELVGAYTLDSR